MPTPGLDNNGFLKGRSMERGGARRRLQVYRVPCVEASTKALRKVFCHGACAKGSVRGLALHKYHKDGLERLHYNTFTVIIAAIYRDHNNRGGPR